MKRQLLAPDVKAILLFLLVAFYASVVLPLYYKGLSICFGPFLGYPWREPPIVYVGTSIILALVPFLWLPRNVRRPSHVILWLLYIMMYLPLIIVPHYSLSIGNCDVFLFNLSTTVGFGIASLAGTLPPIRVPLNKINRKTFISGLVVLFVLFYFYLTHKFGIFLTVPTWSEVYKQRSIFKEILAEKGGGYVVLWIEFWLIPALSVASLYYQRWSKLLSGFLLGLAVILAIYLFNLTAIKSAAFVILGILALWWLLRNSNEFALRLFVSLYVVYGISILIYILGNNGLLIQHILRRILVVPGLNGGYYFELFSKEGPDLFSHSIMRFFIEPVHAAAPPFLVGDTYYGNIFVSANAGFIADAYANLGYIGIFVVSFLLLVVLWVIDSVARKKDLRASSSMFFMQAYALSNSALFTTLLTYGLMFMIITLWLVPFYPNRHDNNGNV